MIYLICFVISISLLRLSEIKKLRKIRKLIIFCALLIPCILAGLRGEVVGSDTAAYPLRMYNIALDNQFLKYMNSTFLHGWNYDYVYNMGIGYSTFVYIVTKVFRDFSVLLFFTEIAIIFPVYKSLEIFSKNETISNVTVRIGYIIFLLLFYNVTLNMMRQWIAMALLLIGFAYITQEQKKKGIILSLISLSFHTTGIVGFIPIAFYLFIERQKTKIKIQNGPKPHSKSKKYL